MLSGPCGAILRPLVVGVNLYQRRWLAGSAEHPAAEKPPYVV